MLFKSNKLKLFTITRQANDLLKKAAAYNGVKESYVVNAAPINLLKKDKDEKKSRRK